MARTEAHPQVSAPQRLTFMTMTAMVVGSMVGAGVFSLPRRFAQETGVAGALIAWVIAGTGMLMLAFVFQTLARGTTGSRRLPTTWRTWRYCARSSPSPATTEAG